MKANPDQTTRKEDVISRRQFSQLLLMFVTLFGIAGPSTVEAGAGRDRAVALPPGKRKRKDRRGIATPEDVAAVALGIDLPVENAWEIAHRIGSEEYRTMQIDPDDVSPRLHRQLCAAHSAPYKTSVVVRVSGDALAILHRASYYAPGERGDHTDDDDDVSMWRVEWEGDGVARVAADNSSWWPGRLAHETPAGWPKRENRERVFAEHWLRENDQKNSYGLNHGCGLAQDLMLSTYRHEKPPHFQPWLSNRERKILATFVQWLGTNCGQSFLYEVKAKGGITHL